MKNSAEKRINTGRWLASHVKMETVLMKCATQRWPEHAEKRPFVVVMREGDVMATIIVGVVCFVVGFIFGALYQALTENDYERNV